MSRFSDWSDETVVCGDGIARPVSQLRKSHREAYPEQYEHPAVGKAVTTPDGTQGTVERVMATRFGPMAMLVGQPDKGWLVSSLTFNEEAP